MIPVVSAPQEFCVCSSTSQQNPDSSVTHLTCVIQEGPGETYLSRRMIEQCAALLRAVDSGHSTTNGSLPPHSPSINTMPSGSWQNVFATPTVEIDSRSAHSNSPGFALSDVLHALRRAAPGVCCLAGEGRARPRGHRPHPPEVRSGVTPAALDR